MGDYLIGCLSKTLLQILNASKSVSLDRTVSQSTRKKAGRESGRGLSLRALGVEGLTQVAVEITQVRRFQF